MDLALSSASSDPALLPIAIGGTLLVAIVVAASSSSSSSKTSPSGTPYRTIHTLPDGMPVVGDLATLMHHEARLHDFVAEMCAKHQYEPWRMRAVGQFDTIMFATPDAFEDVLIKQAKLFPIGEHANEAFAGLVGKSILTTDGEEWYHQRKAAAKFFTGKTLRTAMVHTMRKNVSQLRESLDAAASSGESVELSNLIGQFTLQTFAEIGLGVDLRWIGQDEPHPLDRVVKIGSPAVVRRGTVPVFWWKLERLLALGIEGEMAAAVKDVREWFDVVIKQSLEAIAKRQANQKATDEEPIKSIVEMFFENSSEEKSGLRSTDFVDFLLTFVFAAQDTTALTLTRFFLALADHPAVETRVREEMKSVLPTLGVNQGTYLTADHAQHLTYLEATIREVLRLYPTVPATQRIAAEDTVICGDVQIKQNEQVGLSMYAMARNPSVWGPDAAEFKPARWIDESGSLRVEPPTRFAAFGAGPRQCIGMKLAQLEIRVVAANLLHQYEFSLAAPNNGDYLVGITLMLKHPLMMKVKRV